MKKQLEKLAVFEAFLKVFVFLSKWRLFHPLIKPITSMSAQLNLALNRPRPASDVEALAKTWQQLMPPDGKEFFKIKSVDENTAITEIHIHCPLRGTGDVNACYKLMNYDRMLMKKTGGQLVVLESQSNSGKPFCKLAIRKAGDEVSDLVPAHLKKNR